MRNHRVLVWTAVVVLGAAGRADGRSVVCGNGLAQPSGVAANPAVVRPMHDPSALHFSMPGDGCIWVRAAGYKASFGPGGATYIPYLGPTAPRNYPVSFALKSVDVGGQPVGFETGVSASRTEDTIVFDHGSIREIYQVSPSGIEQMFTFDSLPSGGDLVVRIGVETELAAAVAADGFRFSTDLGHVSYGRALAYDARGERTPATTTLDADAIEIRVPASFLASAAFPVTIDPFVSSFSIDPVSADDFKPDVAYDETTDRYLLVYEETFSSTDHDVFTTFVSSTGVVTFNDYVDITNVYWSSPHVANNNVANNFMTVAVVIDFNLPGDAYRARGATIDAATGTIGSRFTVSTGTPGLHNYGPDIGGDPAMVGPTYYLVTWTNGISLQNYDICARLVDTAGNPQGSGPIFVNNSAAYDTGSRISKSNGHAPSSTQAWTIVWYRNFNGSPPELWAAQYRSDGSLAHSSYLIHDSQGEFFTDYSVSSLLDGASGERDYLVAIGQSSDISARIFNGTTLRCVANISALEGQGFLPREQRGASVDSDGNSYAIAYMETGTSTSEYDIYVASVARNGNAMQVAERHVNYESTTHSSVLPAITSTYSGGGAQRRFMLAWSTFGGVSDRDIYGGFYDAGTFASYCSPAGGFFDQTIPCPCGNTPSSPGRGCDNSSFTGGAQLSSTGVASLSNDTLSFTSTGERPSATSTFWQGSMPAFSGIVFGAGVRCVGGALKRLYVHAASGGVVSAPVGTDLSVHARSAALGDPISAGSARYYFVSYRDPVVLYGCPAIATFNASQSGSLIWYP